MTTLEEHIGYLADRVRLERFGQALSTVVRPGDVVADVGCGVGVLGLVCLQLGAGRVHGIDRTDAIELARETMARQGLSDRYHCLREHSYRAVLPEPVDLVVCDHVGCFGFDYGIVRTLGDARRRFLKPGGTVMPRGIVPMLAGIASAECRARAEAWASEPVPAEFHWLRDYGVNSKYLRYCLPDEIATGPARLGTIDLRSDSPEHFAFRAVIRASRDCTLDGLCGWFECELAEGVWMTNSPLAPDRIDRPQVVLPLDRPMDLLAGDEIEIALSIRHEEPIISWNLFAPRTGYRSKQSTWKSRIMGGAEPVHHADRIPTINPRGKATRFLLDQVDGKRSHREIEAALLREHPDVLPSPAEIENFVRRVLDKSAD